MLVSKPLPANIPKPHYKTAPGAPRILSAWVSPFVARGNTQDIGRYAQLRAVK